jgi:hypothetical protein
MATDLDEIKIRQRAEELHSDGCTGVTQFYIICCWEHDIYYRTGQDLDEKPLTRTEADRRFRACIQKRSKFGKLSPMALWRWAGVRVFGRKAWQESRAIGAWKETNGTDETSPASDHR